MRDGGEKVGHEAQESLGRHRLKLSFIPGNSFWHFCLALSPLHKNNLLT